MLAVLHIHLWWFYFFSSRLSILGQSLAPWGDFAASLCFSLLLRSIWLLAFSSYTRSFDSLNVGVLRDTTLIKQTRVWHDCCPANKRYLSFSVHGPILAWWAEERLMKYGCQCPECWPVPLTLPPPDWWQFLLCPSSPCFGLICSSGFYKLRWFHSIWCTTTQPLLFFFPCNDY